MILVTGGAGYIGSHTCVALAQAGHELWIVDNLCNSRANVVDQLTAIDGRCSTFIEGDCRDVEMLDDIVERHPIKAAMHFAGLKAVGESIAKSLEYYVCVQPPHIADRRIERIVSTHFEVDTWPQR